MIIDNPELVRLLRSKLRPAKMALLAAIGLFVYGGLLVLFYLVDTDFGRTPMKNAADMFHNYFFWVTGIQWVGVGMLGLMLAAQNVALERERSTLDFQRLVGMGPWRLAAGKLFGGPAEAFFVAAVGTLFAGISIMGGGVSFSVFVQTQVCLFVFCMLTSAFGLLCSSVTEKTANALGLAVLIPVIYGIVASAVVGRDGLTILSTSNSLRVLTVLYQSSSPGFHLPVETEFSFFGLQVPMLVGYVLVNMLLAWVCFVTTARRLASEEFSYISLRHSVIAFVLVEMILIGGVVSEVPGKTVIGFGHPGLAAFHAGNFCLLIALAFGLSPNAELFRGRLYRANRDEHWKVVLERGNKLQDASPMAALLLFSLAYAVIACVVAIFEGRTELANYLVIAMNCGVGLTLASGLVYLHIYMEKSSFRAAMGLLILALIFPPLIIAVVSSWQHTVLVSPIVYIAMLGELIDSPNKAISYSNLTVPTVLWSCPMICGVLGVLSFILAAMRIRFLLDLHEQQRKAEAEADRKADAKLSPSTAAARLLASTPANREA